jgi:hypothetical protein
MLIHVVLAEFYKSTQSLEDHSSLLAMLIQDQSDTPETLARKLLKKLFTSTLDKDLNSKHEGYLHSFLEYNCKRVNYGSDLPNAPTVKKDNKELVFIPVGSGFKSTSGSG